MNFEVNSFQIPNALVDDLMRDISPNALKCYLIIVRKTKGWGKEWDRISTLQLMEIAGIKKKDTVYSATKELIKYGLIEAVKQAGKMTSFKVVPKMGTGTKKSSHQERNRVVPKNGTTTSPENRDTTKDTIKNTRLKTTLSSKSPLSLKPIKASEREDKSFLSFVSQIRKLYKPDPNNDLYPPILQIKTLGGEKGYFKVDAKGHLYVHTLNVGIEDIDASDANHYWHYLHQMQDQLLPAPKSNQGNRYEVVG